MVEFEEGRPSEKLLKLQEVQQDLAAKLVDYCEARGFQPFLAAGSALGAWRDKGFIPWDDDIDLGMLREDYDRFVAAYLKEPIPGITLQNCTTVSRFPFAFSKLRIDGTWVDETPSMGEAYHSGIFIDLFPYDALPASPLVRKLQMFILLAINLFVLSFSRQFAAGARNPFFRTLRLFAVAVRPVMPINALIALREWLYRCPLVRFSDEVICFQMYGLRKSDKTRVLRTDLVPPQHVMFGDRLMPVPANCDKYLKRIFGDYQAPPPLDMQKPGHIRDVKFGSWVSCLALAQQLPEIGNRLFQTFA